jgi:hypothetical protein
MENFTKTIKEVAENLKIPHEVLAELQFNSETELSVKDFYNRYEDYAASFEGFGYVMLFKKHLELIKSLKILENYFDFYSYYKNELEDKYEVIYFEDFYYFFLKA